MGKTVVISMGQGTLQLGFPRIVVRLWTVLDLRAEQFIGSLPAAPEIIGAYQNWQATYQGLSNRLVLRQPTAALDQERVDDPDHGPGHELDDGLEIDEGGITNISLPDFDVCSQEMERLVNQWLTSEGFQKVERQMRSHLTPTDEIRVIIETDDEILLRLPWHCWQFFEDYPGAEMALSRPEYQRQTTVKTRSDRQTVRILAIVGDRRGIDIEPEQEALQGLADAEVEFVVTPTRQAFDQMLWHSEGWDILFFAGHSCTEQETGRIYINEQPSHNSLTIKQLDAALKGAIAHGLKLAIFNSCDGVGLAQALGDLQIPQVIVMREPVPNRVAQEFLRNFLDAFAQRQLPLYPAMRQARQRLQGLEDEFPGASWLPVLCQNPAVEPLTWGQLRGMPSCPYRGLAAFQEADAALFFGREQVTTDVLAWVKRKAMVAVVGPSGSGKSSVVFAGLVPHLRQAASSTPWHIVSCRPGAKPFDALAKAWLEWDARGQGQTLDPIQHSSDEDHSFRLRVLELAVDLQHDRQTLCQVIDRHHYDHPGTRLLLIIDQFEELYTLCPEADRQPFLDSLLDAVQAAPAFTLVLTLRADFYGYALSDRRFSDALQSAVYNLGPMNRRELEEAIAQPAAKMQVQLEPGLTDKLIQSTWDHAGRLPLLEFALTELWSNQVDGWLTHGAYEAIGGVEEALANHAELIYAQLTPVDQQRMQRVFVQLVEPGVGTSSTRRLATQDEVGETNWDLVAHLASKRLVVTNRDETSGDETVEIVHEALIVGWGRLGEWLQQDGDFRRWQEELRRSRRLWEKGDREDDALLRGKRLADAKEWYGFRLEELSDGDRDFIERSVLSQERGEKKRKRRRQFIVSSLTVGLLAALGLSGMTWWGWQIAQLREIQAIATSSDALFISGQRLDALVASLTAQHKLQKLFWIDQETKNRVELTLRQALSRADEKNRLIGHTAGVTAIAFSPNGQLILSASQDRTIRIWNADGSLRDNLVGHSDEIWGIAISPDGQMIASASNDKTIKLWNREGHLLNTLQEHSDEVNSVAFSPDGQTIASGSSDNTVKLWHRDGSLLKTFKDHSGAVHAVSFNPDGQTIASASSDNTLKLWHRDGSLLKTFQKHRARVNAVSFSPDGQVIASASLDNTVKVWNLDGDLLHDLIGHRSRVYSVAFSPDGQLITSASQDGTVKVWTREGQSISTLQGHNYRVYGVAFSPDNQTIASAGGDGTVRLWQPNNNPLLTTFNGHTGAIWGIDFSSDGQTIASASADKTIRLWAIDGSWNTTLKGHSDSVYGLAFAPDNQTIVSASRDMTSKIWDQQNNTPKTLSGHQDWVTWVDFSPDGQIIASASADKKIKLWSKNGSLLKTIDAQDRVWRLAFSPDNQLLASASNDKTIKLWNLDGTLVNTLKGHNAPVNAVAFSSDGHFIVSGSSDKTVKLWGLDGTSLKTLHGHHNDVIQVTFSPNNQLIASTSIDKTINIWDKDGTLLNTLNGYSSGVNGIAFSPDGETLASSSSSQIIIWNLNNALAISNMTSLGCEWVRDYLVYRPDLKVCE